MIESAAAKALWSQWHSLVLRDGVLFRQTKGKRGRPSVLQLKVPTVKRSEYISHCHRGMTGGHRAFRSTLDQASRRGFWIGWRRDVARFCRQCLSCSSYHRGHLQPMITGSIMERCHIDITGPHPRTPRGSKYILTFVEWQKWQRKFSPHLIIRELPRINLQSGCHLHNGVGEMRISVVDRYVEWVDIDKAYTVKSQRGSYYLFPLVEMLFGLSVSRVYLHFGCNMYSGVG